MQGVQHMSKDYSKLFADGIERGKAQAEERKMRPFMPQVEQEGEETKLLAAPPKSALQTLFEIAREHASEKDFNIAEWEANKKEPAGFILETAEDYFDAKGKVFWPSIEVKVASNAKGETFSVTLEDEGEPQTANNVSMDEAVNMVAVYIGNYAP